MVVCWSTEEYGRVVIRVGVAVIQQHGAGLGMHGRYFVV